MTQDFKGGKTDYAAQMGWSAGCLATQKPGSASGANLALRCDVYPDTRHLGPSGDDTLVVQTLHGRGWRVLWLADVDAMVATQGASSLSEWIVQRCAGPAKHYPWRTQRTAWWMAWMAFMQLGLVAAAILEPSNGVWQLALDALSVMRSTYGLWRPSRCGLDCE